MSLVGTIVGYIKRVIDEYGKPKDQVILEVPAPEEYNWSPEEERIVIAHDYVRFHGSIGIQQKSLDDGSYPVKKTVGACNWIYTKGSVTFDIRVMRDIILPMLNKHKYMQDDHFKTRTDSDENYEPYCYNGCIMHFYDSVEKIQKVSFRRTGEAKWETVSLSLFNDIKNLLQLQKSQKEIQKEKEGSKED